MQRVSQEAESEGYDLSECERLTTLIAGKIAVLSSQNTGEVEGVEDPEFVKYVA